jgi:hypothetical protein
LTIAKTDSPSGAVIRCKSVSTTAPRRDTAYETEKEDEEDDDDDSQQNPTTPIIPRSRAPVDVVAWVDTAR